VHATNAIDRCPEEVRDSDESTLSAGTSEWWRSVEMVECECGDEAKAVDGSALGYLRKELIDRLGLEAARDVLLRVSFVRGWQTAEKKDPRPDWFDVSSSSQPLTELGARLAGSFEAEQHLLHVGPAEEPVCWSACGFASGFLSRSLGRRVIVREDRCIARGDAECHMVAEVIEAWRVFEFDEKDHEASARNDDGREAEHDHAVPGMIVRSAAMRAVVALAQRVAPVDSTVLVTGESGAGKERIARLVHERSPRANGPFLAINCGAMTESLLETELFGHAKGAFTGAAHERMGLFEAANGGTLLLDEIGEISPGMQVKLLRVLQEREIRRVGENRVRAVDVRVVAATNRDLAREVRDGRFRQDLYYRLKVVEVHAPPLRERRDDIMPLARWMLSQAAQRMKRPMPSLSPAVVERLQHYDWPGNVRELENAMERAVALARGTRVDLEDLPPEMRTFENVLTGFPIVDRMRRLDIVEREHVLAVYEHLGRNQTRTAEVLGIGTTTLYRKLRAWGVIRPALISEVTRT
jgi:two-component system response regulator HydG